MNKVTLIRGSSGTGKTTLFQAIAWALFGHLKMITPITNDKARTSVKLTLPYHNTTLSIQRSRHPNRLAVTFEGKEYQDKAGQALLDQFFGDHDLWHVTSYLTQVCRNEFLTYSVQAKMDLLHTISFQQESPMEIINKLDEVIATTQLSYQSQLTAYEQEVAHVTALSAGKAEIDVPSDATMQGWKEAITQVEIEITKLQERALERRSQLQVLAHLRSLVRTLSIPQPPSSALPLRETTPAQSSSWISILGQIEALTQKQGTYVASPSTCYTLAQIQEATIHERDRIKHMKLAKTLNVPYTSEAIVDTRKNIQSLLNSQPRAQAQEHIRTLAQKMAKLATPLPSPVLPQPLTLIPFDESPFDVTLAQQELQELLLQQSLLAEQQSRGNLNCPQCEVPLHYTEGVLRIGQGTYTQAELDQQRRELESNIYRLRMSIDTKHQQRRRAQATHEQQAEQKRKAYAQALSSYEQWQWREEQRQQEHAEIQRQHTEAITLTPLIPAYTCLSPAEIQRYQQTLAQLHTLEVLPSLKVAVAEMQQSLAQQQAAQRYQELQEEIESLRVQLPLRLVKDKNLLYTSTQLRTLVGEWQEYNYALTRYEEQCGEQRELAERIASHEAMLVPDESDKLASAQTRLQELRDRVKEGEEAQHLSELYQQAEASRETVMTAHIRLSRLRALREQAVNAECRVLDAVVDSINTSINDVCETIFDRDIALELQLFKTAKSTNVVRHNVHFSIRYRGGTFDHISQLSMGEGDRVSLALTLALNRLSSCPFLLLDETLRSLDLDRKENVVQAIRENYSATVLLIMHDGVEGMFDHVINLEEYDK